MKQQPWSSYKFLIKFISFQYRSGTAYKLPLSHPEDDQSAINNAALEMQ